MLFFLVIFAAQKLEMKKLIYLYLLFFSFTVFAQEGIRFEKIPFKEILAKAKKENKLVFIDAMASWCGPCKMMEKNVFTKKEVADFYNSTFINATFDMEIGEGREIAQKYGVQSYPTYLFLNGDGQLISRNMGYMAESLFIDLGKEANAAVKNIGSLRERFDKGEKSPEFLINIIKLNSNSDYEFAKLASERYFENKKTKEFTKDELGYLLFFVKSYLDPNYKFFVENKAEIIKVMTEEQYTQYDNFYKLQKLMTDAVDEKNKIIKEEFFMTNAEKLVGKEEADKALWRLKLNFYEIQDLFPMYEKTALTYYADSEKFDTQDLLKAAWIFSEKATNPNSLKKAQEWAEKSVMRQETAENTYILAKIYQKSGKMEEAKMFAEASLKLAQKTGNDSLLAEKLLTELK